MGRFAVLLISVGIFASGCAGLSPAPQTVSRTVVITRPAQPPSFTADHAAIVRAYYGNGNQGRGRGRGNGGLPPGIAKNLARGKPLPPGLAKQYLPNDLLRRLPPLPTGLEYVVIAGKLLLVEAATQVVREVLLEAVFG